MGWRPIVSAIGRVFMAAGTLMLLFVAYQLWGTGLSEARSQDKLSEEFDAVRVAAPPVVVDPSKTEFAPPPPTGAAIAIIKIPRIGVEKTVVQGVGVEDLKKAPGHYPDTPMPGQAGNAAIAGHRTTYGAPFYNLDEVKPSDPILVTTVQGSFRYEVVDTKVVRPSQVEVLENTGDNRLTLTTCHPRFSASQRMVVTAKLVGTALPPPEPPQEPVTPPASIDAGLSGGTTARTPSVLWGLAFAAVWATAYGIRRLVGHKWIVWPIALVPMGITLFIFFENFARLLPANV
ncbi:MAG TPA: class E sortase [Acidimicrobiales bacterium]|nr:class E sortase [Acidimicrobiales bacterium]